MPVSKTFASGEILTAPDVNTYLNPAVNPQIAFSVAAGRWSGAASATAGQYFSVAVTFPSGRFSQVPIVQATITSVAAGNAKLVVRASNVTTTGFTLYLYDVGGTALSATSSVDWFAVQMKTNAAAG